MAFAPTLATISFGQFDAVLFDPIDRPDMDAVRANYTVKTPTIVFGSMLSQQSESCVSWGPHYFAAGGRSLWSIKDCSALRNEASVSTVFVNPACLSFIVLTKARGPSGAP
jgi:hypothetical protein